MVNLTLFMDTGANQFDFLQRLYNHFFRGSSTNHDMHDSVLMILQCIILYSV